MTATPPEPPPAPPAGKGDQQAQIDSLATRQEQTDRKIDELLNLVKGGKPGDPAKPPASPPAPADGGSMEERVQAELARRDQATRDAEREREHADLKATVAKLGEKPPRQPGSRRTKLLGWGDGRG